MIGKIFITRTGYDPQLGRHVKDPYLGPSPSLGACRPDVRRKIRVGDHVFVISGKIKNAKQFIMCGFEVVRKMDARDAYFAFPERRLCLREDGQLSGNIIVDANGAKHPLDDHPTFSSRLPNYLIGDKNIAPTSPCEIAPCREQTLDVLREVLGKNGSSPIEIVGRWGSQLTEEQVYGIRDWLLSLKRPPESRTLN